MPDIFLVKAEKLVVFDNFSNKIKIIINTFLDTGSYDQSIEEIAHIEDELKKENNFEPKDFSLKVSEEVFDSNFSKADFLKAFKKSALEKFESKTSSDTFNEKSLGSKLFSFLSSSSMWAISSID